MEQANARGSRPTLQSVLPSKQVTQAAAAKEKAAENVDLINPVHAKAAFYATAGHTDLQFPNRPWYYGNVDRALRTC